MKGLAKIIMVLLASAVFGLSGCGGGGGGGSDVTQPTNQTPSTNPPVVDSMTVIDAWGKPVDTAKVYQKHKVNINIKATDSTGVTAYYISESPSTPDTLSSDWHTVPSNKTLDNNAYDFLLSMEHGKHTVYAWVKNTQGIISSPKSIEYTNENSLWSEFDLIEINSKRYTDNQDLSAEIKGLQSRDVKLKFTAVNDYDIDAYCIYDYWEYTGNNGKCNWVPINPTKIFKFDGNYHLSTNDETRVLTFAVRTKDLTFNNTYDYGAFLSLANYSKTVWIDYNIYFKSPQSLGGYYLVRAPHLILYTDGTWETHGLTASNTAGSTYSIAYTADISGTYTSTGSGSNFLLSLTGNGTSSSHDTYNLNENQTVTDFVFKQYGDGSQFYHVEFSLPGNGMSSVAFDKDAGKLLEYDFHVN